MSNARRITTQPWMALAAAAVILFSTAPLTGQSVITTVAGTDWFLTADGKPGTSVPLSAEIRQIATDAQGNLYVPDEFNQVVFRIGTDGVAHIFAGNGIAGFSGDGGAAVNASLNNPFAVAVDKNGNVFISDYRNYRIRRISPGGIISTVAGSGVNGFSGDGGPATQAQFGFVSCLAFDNNNDLLICDETNNRVRKVTPAGVVSTIAGNGKQAYSGDGGAATLAALNQPQGLLTDPAGHIYIAEFGNQTVRRIELDGTISTFAGNGTHGFSGDGGPAARAQLAQPDGLVLDSAGNLYIGDSDNSRIRMVNPAGIITTVAGSGAQGFGGDNGSPLQASFHFPNGLAMDSSGRLYVGDTGNARVRAITLGARVQTIAGNGLFRYTPAGTPANQVYLFHAAGVASDAPGNLYIADTLDFVVRKVTPDGLTRTFAGAGTDASGPDGVSATQSGLSSPFGVAVAPNGDVLIADTFNYQVHRIGPDGVIHLVAGSLNHVFGYSGDGGPATQALLNLPTAVAADAAGNVYIADSGNNVIRRVSNGTITTFAGNGMAQSSGDGLRAPLASLNNPTGVAVDGLGNVYVAEFNGYRIRKISANGFISTYAGTGVNGSSGDGGLAASAQLANVFGLALDSQGNLFLSESSTNKVRRISAGSGIITTVAGNGQAGYSGDGGPATLAALSIPNGLAVGSDGTLYIADRGNSRIRAVRTVSVTVVPSITQLSFSVTSQGSPSQPQTIHVSSSSPGYPFTAQATGGSWLSVTPQSGGLPTDVLVSVDPSQLGPGTYTGAIAIQTPGTTPAAQMVAVTVSVAPPVPGKLAVSNQSLAISVTQGSPGSTTQLNVTNQGGGSIPFTASASTTTGGNWLQVSPASATATPNAPALVTITATPGNLAPGVYQGTVTMSSAATGENIPVAVTLAISSAQQKIQLSQNGLTFTAVAQGGSPLPQTFGILNTGQGSMSWSAASSTLSGGPGWLSIDKTSGSVAAPYTDVSVVTASINTAGLAAGQYYGQIQVKAAGAANSPQSVSVLLNVLPPGSNPGPEIRPSALIFLGTAGNSPGSQNVQVSNPKTSALTLGSSISTSDGGNWLVNLPATAILAPNTPVQMVVQPDYTGFAPGVFQGSLTLGFLEDGSSRTVNVLAVVAPPGTSLPPQASAEDSEAAGCTSLMVQPTSLTDPTAGVTLSQPATLQARIVDNCGNLLTNGTVVATFSNGDAKVNLVHLGGGNWSATWKPQNGGVSKVTVTITAFVGQGTTFLSGSAKLTVSLLSGSATPVTSGAGNAASYVGNFIAPGGLVAIFGQQLAGQTAQPSSLPFPTEINGTQVLMEGTPLPLRYVGSGQINAQVPFEVGINSQQQLIVVNGGAVSVPQDVIVAAAQPGVYTQDQSGSGPGVIVNGSTNQLITSANPAQAGDVVVIYCNGLGAVNPAIPTGAPAPLDGPVSQTVNPVTVTIGGVNALVDFAGLTPGYPDLYQVNAHVPAGLAPGQTPVVVTVTPLGSAPLASPPVTMAVQ